MKVAAERPPFPMTPERAALIQRWGDLSGDHELIAEFAPTMSDDDLRRDIAAFELPDDGYRETSFTVID